MSTCKPMKWPIYDIVNESGDKYLGVDEEWHDNKTAGCSVEPLQFWQHERELAERYAKTHQGVVVRNSNP